MRNRPQNAHNRKLIKCCNITKLQIKIQNCNLVLGNCKKGRISQTAKAIKIKLVEK